MAEKAGFILYMDQYPPIAALSLEQKGRLLDAFFRFNAGEEPAFDDPLLGMAFAFFRQTFTRDSAKYEQKCLKNRENALKRLEAADGGDRKQPPAPAANRKEGKPESNRATTEPESKEIAESHFSASASPGAAPDAACARAVSPCPVERSGEESPDGARDDARDGARDGARDDAPGDAPGDVPGDAPGDVPGHPPGDAPGHPPGDAPGDAPSPSAWYETRKKRRLTGRRLESFNRFWRAFGYPKGKAEAADAWLDIPKLTNALVEAIVDAAGREAAARPGLAAKGRSPKWAQGWLAARRWEDGDEAADSVPTLDELLRRQGIDP